MTYLYGLPLLLLHRGFDTILGCGSLSGTQNIILNVKKDFCLNVKFNIKGRVFSRRSLLGTSAALDELTCARS